MSRSRNKARRLLDTMAHRDEELNRCSRRSRGCWFLLLGCRLRSRSCEKEKEQEDGRGDDSAISFRSTVEFPDSCFPRSGDGQGTRGDSRKSKPKHERVDDGVNESSRARNDSSVPKFCSNERNERDRRSASLSSFRGIPDNFMTRRSSPRLPARKRYPGRTRTTDPLATDAKQK